MEPGKVSMGGSLGIVVRRANPNRKQALADRLAALLRRIKQ